MNRIITSAAAVTAMLVLGACGSSGRGSSSGGTAAARSTTTVSVAQVDGVGTVLVDSSGKALYSPDEEANGKILCTDACLSFWTPLDPGSGTPTAPAGAANLGVTTRPDGTKQVTDDGKPLYTFSEDSPGQVKGNGFSDDFGGQHFMWHAVLAAGTAAGSPGTTTSDSSGGYPGY